MITKTIKYRRGTMTKSPRQMSAIELKKWQEQGYLEARAYLFSINQPMVYYIDDAPVIEYKDGRIEKL